MNRLDTKFPNTMFPSDDAKNNVMNQPNIWKLKKKQRRQNNERPVNVVGSLSYIHDPEEYQKDENSINASKFLSRVNA